MNRLTLCTAYLCRLSRIAKTTFPLATASTFRSNINDAAPAPPEYLKNRTISPEELLSQLTPEDAHRLELIKVEHDILYKGGQSVPTELTNADYVELLCLMSKSARRNHYLFRFKVEKKRENELAKKKAVDEMFKVSHDGPLPNTIIRKIEDKIVRRHFDDRAYWSCMYGQPLVFDMSHEDEMRIQDVKNLADQLSMVIGNNRMSRDPFHIVLSSMQPVCNQRAYLNRIFCLDSPRNQLSRLEDLPISVSPRYYQDLFPSPEHRVIYLTPNAPRMLEEGEWDDQTVYIIGGIVDKAVRRPVTFAKGRREGVEMARLPLERYIKWRQGAKTLTLVAIHRILASAKASRGDWAGALRDHVPKRFVEPGDQLARDRIERIFKNL